MYIRVVKPSILLPPASEFKQGIIKAASIARLSRGKMGILPLDRAERLFSRILKRKPFAHESVLEHATFTLFIRASRKIVFQLVRHRHISPTQISTRFVPYKKEIVLIDPTLGDFVPFFGDTNNPGFWKEETPFWIRSSARTFLEAFECEKIHGWKQEQFCYMYPHTLAAEIYVTLNLRELRYIISLRDHKDASPEISYIFHQAREYMRSISPVLLERVYGEKEDADELLKEALDFFEREGENYTLRERIKEYFNG